MDTFKFDEYKYENDYELIEVINENVCINKIEKFFKNNIENFEFETILSIIICKSEGFSFLKSKGVFRVFDNINNSLHVFDLLERLLKLKSRINIDEIYIEMKLEFKKIVEPIKRKIDKYTNIALHYKEFAILDIMSICAKKQDLISNNLKSKIKNINFDSKEISFVDYCNGASIFISLLCEQSNMFKSNTKHLYADRDFNIEKSLIFFNKLYKLREYEIYIDCFGFKVCKNNNTFTLSSPNKDLMKCISCCTILSFFERMNSAYYTRDFSGISFSEFVNKDKEYKLDKIIKTEYKDNFNYKRYVFSITNLFGKLFKENFLFKEEMTILDALAREFVVPEVKLLNMKFRNNLNIWDVFKFKRIFDLWNEKIKRLEFSDNSIYFNTVSQRLKRSDFNLLFKYLYDNEEKITDMIEMMNFNAANSIKDILYSPFVVLDDFVYFSPILVSQSNIPGNCISVAKYKSLNDENYRIINNRNEYVEELLRKVCEQTNIKCRVGEMDFSYRGIKSDIDVLLYNDDYMIIVECKSPTASTNAFELRKIYSYLEKGAKQLDLSLKAMQDDDFYKNKMHEWNIPIRKRKIYSLICNAQREFNGIFINNHPVRSVKEMCNYLLDGTIIVSNNEYVVRTNDDVFESLIEYIGNNSFIFKVLDSLTEYKEMFHIENKKFEMENFALDARNLDSILSREYEKLEQSKIK